ncbi:MAG: 3-deoxy-D-manno-octulosonic acid transferase [Desulfurivibrionaceae bacterium]
MITKSVTQLVASHNNDNILIPHEKWTLSSIYYRLYQLFTWVVFVVGGPFFLVYIAITGKHKNSLGQRLGFVRNRLDSIQDRPLRIWMHAASVGEVQAARALITEMKKAAPEIAIIVSTVTKQGHLVARKQLGENIPCIYAPLDVPIFVRRAFNAIRPAVYICLETELWPCQLKAARHFGCKIVLLNGRLSERSFQRYKKIKVLTKSVLDQFLSMSVIQAEHADRFIALGIAPGIIEVNGNLKYDQGTPAVQETVTRYRNLLSMRPGQSVLVAGSTHKGEEAILVDVFERLKTRYRDLLLVLAPRNLERIKEIENLLSLLSHSF